MKKILTLILLFASSIVHSADNDGLADINDFREWQNKWYIMGFSISEINRIFLFEEECKLMHTHQSSSKNETIYIRTTDEFTTLYEVSDFWYDCTDSKTNKSIRKCDDASGNRTSNEWENAFNSCLEENLEQDKIEEYKTWDGFKRTLGGHYYIQQCRAGYEYKFNRYIQLVYCRYR